MMVNVVTVGVDPFLRNRGRLPPGHRGKRLDPPKSASQRSTTGSSIPIWYPHECRVNAILNPIYCSISHLLFNIPFIVQYPIYFSISHLFFNIPFIFQYPIYFSISHLLFNIPFIVQYSKLLFNIPFIVQYPIYRSISHLLFNIPFIFQYPIYFSICHV